eukprot:6469203-Amphidinium_carterae.2
MALAIPLERAMPSIECILRGISASSQVAPAPVDLSVAPSLSPGQAPIAPSLAWALLLDSPVWGRTAVSIHVDAARRSMGCLPRSALSGQSMPCQPLAVQESFCSE